MEYRKKKSSLMMENLTIVFMLAFTIMMNNWLLKGVLIFFIALLLKDQIVNRNYYIKTSQDEFCEKKGKNEKCFKYKNIEFVTVSRKFKKYVAIGNTDEFILIRNNVDNRVQLVNHIIEKSKLNKNFYLDDKVKLVLERYQ